MSRCVSGSVAVSAAGDSVLTPPVAARATVLYSAARGSTTLLATRTYTGLQNIALLLKLLHEYWVLGCCYPRVDMSPCCQRLSPPRRCGGWAGQWPHCELQNSSRMRRIFHVSFLAECGPCLPSSAGTPHHPPPRTVSSRPRPHRKCVVWYFPFQYKNVIWIETGNSWQPKVYVFQPLRNDGDIKCTKTNI